MVEFRTHGKPPFQIVVLHGGPGAWGEMAPVAEYLSDTYGIIEPFFLEATLPEQLLELKQIIDIHNIEKVVLIGFSWGAWLRYLFAAKFPNLMKKLILVGSGPYKHQYYLELIDTRNNRMSQEQKEHYSEILNNLQDPNMTNNDASISQLGALCRKIDQYNDLEVEEPFPTPHFDIDRTTHFQKAMNEVIRMRKSGDLLKEAEKIKCPVVAIHGDYDPHPVNGVKIPLEKKIVDFQFFLLEKCGHKPWTERYARLEFYKLINSLLIFKD
ncbi:alpha/beta fold hydrolase [Promethearchaeum syntrophicum]|uniref:Alpha/beta fold hydrolase n=1 Tax=Promethearchaeum syntrophicum TaxID=2594042 RepID=A0A5B9D694_9ARCH|nr:alpha/beta hydrolase [Candidatus Prometheoarchaeum syntrophicum]QEE14317.1 2-hydroxy-6-oxononadienedioate/2-hydroxy-6-oxononatrienedioate hydrolase [Candidatus Prometheoarchaeum syntrophicum]